MDTYLLKNEKHIQAERAQYQDPPTQYPLAQYQQNPYPQPQYQKNLYTLQQHYAQPRGVEIFKVKDNNKEEEDLVAEEAKSYAIIVDN